MGPWNQTLGPQAGQPFHQQIPHTPRQLSGHANQDPAAWFHKGGYALVKKIHGQIQIFFGEVDAFGRGRGSGTLQSHHPGHLALGHAEHFEPVPPQISGRGQRQIGHGRQVGQGIRGQVGQEPLIKGAGLTNVGQQVPKFFQLIGFQGGPGSTAGQRAGRFWTWSRRPEASKVES